MSLRTCLTLILALGAFCQGAIGAQELPKLSREEIAPPDVLRAVRLLSEELELVRQQMGRPNVDLVERKSGVVPRGAFPRNVFYQALRVRVDSRRLANQFVALPESALPIPIGEILPGDVYQPVFRTLMTIRTIKASLGIERKLKLPARNDEATPTDVFKAITRANRQLDLMLDTPCVAADVHDELQLSIQLLTKVCLVRGIDPSIPDVALLHQRTPHEVQTVLLRASGRLYRIMQSYGYNAIVFEARNPKDTTTSLRDLNEIAIGLVSDLEFLQLKEVRGTKLRRLHYPGWVFPSHLNQAAQQLDALLVRIEGSFDAPKDRR